ncbi:MAG: NeuD/PglB/VioB family sugar acetyltransferase, partial [Bacteroidaceae bacterium]
MQFNNNIESDRSVIIGAGYYGEVFKSYLTECGVNVIGYIDDTPEYQHTIKRGLPILGPISEMKTLKEKYNVNAVYCSISNNVARLSFLREARKFGLKTPHFIHPTAIISPDAEINGTLYLMPGSIIQPYAQIGDGCLLLMNVVVAHHTSIEEGCFISSSSSIGAKMKIEKYVWIGIGATVMTGVHTLGENCLIGAGAVVISDIPQNAVV